MVYTKLGCADTAPLLAMIERVHPYAATRGWARGRGGTCAACVPADDKRAPWLPQCTATQAACRAPFYRPRYPHSADAAEAAAALAPGFSCDSHRVDIRRVLI